MVLREWIHQQEMTRRRDELVHEVKARLAREKCAKPATPGTHCTVLFLSVLHSRVVQRNDAQRIDFYRGVVVSNDDNQMLANGDAILCREDFKGEQKRASKGGQTGTRWVRLFALAG